MAPDPISPLVAPSLDDDALWRAFHDRTLPAAQWTHAAHLRIAWLHLARHELDEAHLRMRVGIIRLNAAPLALAVTYGRLIITGADDSPSSRYRPDSGRTARGTNTRRRHRRLEAFLRRARAT